MMCHPSALAFGYRVIEPEHVRGRSVLEVGSRDVNGSLRPFIEAMGPWRYLGVDIEAGPRVDRVLDAEIPGLCGAVAGPFDLVVCTEVLEHVRDWREAVVNLKECVRPGGRLLITTRSLGFPRHGYPGDHWRYEVKDLDRIFADFAIDSLESDSEIPGVFLYARRPGSEIVRVDLSGIELYAVPPVEP